MSDLYLNDIIARMPYQTKATKEELIEMLPHKWKLNHPEAIITKEKRSEYTMAVTARQQLLQLPSLVVAAVVV